MGVAFLQVVFETGPTGSAALFSQPVNMILARQPSEVDAALDRMDAALDEGYWIAGYLTYELGYAIESKLLSLMPNDRRQPLLSLGVYECPKEKLTFEDSEVWFGTFTQNGLVPIIDMLLSRCMDIFRQVIFIRQI